MMTNVLVVDDHPEAGFSEAISQQFPDWEFCLVGSGTEAVERLKTKKCDAIVVDMRIAGGTGTQLLNDVGRDRPEVIRFIMGEPMEKETASKAVIGLHHFLAKPCEPSVLGKQVTRAITMHKWLENPKMTTLVGRIRTFPSIPSLYFEVLKELRSPDPSAQRVGQVVAKDLAMCTKMLQVLNSAFYALPRQITDTTEAVNVLGFEMVKSLVLCIQVFSQFEKIKPFYFSIDKLWRHSTMVAHAARQIARFEEMDAETAEEAYTAGLLHDIGKLVLVSSFADQYKEVQETARREQAALWDVERTVFGASHAEIGAYLLGIWNLPLSLAEAVSFHHFPSREGGNTPGALLAVHAANALTCQRLGDPDGFIFPTIHDDYLARLNLVGRAPLWREVILGKAVERPQPQSSLVDEIPIAQNENTVKDNGSRWKNWLKIGRTPR